MSGWGLLALVFAGAFFALLLVVIFYWSTIRPRLLDMSQPPAPEAPPVDDRFYEAIVSLNEALVRHSALVARLPSSFAVRADDEGEAEAAVLAAIEAFQREQDDVLASLIARQDKDALKLDALRQQLTSYIIDQQTAVSLQDIKGIGAVYAERLKSYGITSLEQLIQYTPDQLGEIVQAPRGLRANTASWIEQARALLQEVQRDSGGAA